MDERDPMSIPYQEAVDKQMWACVEIDQAAYERHAAFNRSLRSKGWKDERGVQFQYDGQIYPLDDEQRRGALRIGEKVWMPLHIAQHGVRRTAVWEFQTDEYGKEINKPDFHERQPPVLRIIQVSVPALIGKPPQAGQVPVAVIPSQCPFCAEQVQPEALRSHIESEHMDGRQQPGPAARRQPKEVAAVAS